MSLAGVLGGKRNVSVSPLISFAVINLVGNQDHGLARIDTRGGLIKRYLGLAVISLRGSVVFR